MKTSNSVNFNRLLELLELKGIKTAFINNLVTMNGSDRVSWLKTNRYTQPCDLLVMSFLWDKTSQGRDFWKDVWEYVYDGTLDLH